MPNTLGKFYRWKYSGIIVVPGSVALILLVWFSYTGTLEFYDSWSCETIYNYIADESSPGVTPHGNLSDKQHLHLHELVEECQEYNRFAEPIVHP